MAKYEAEYTYSDQELLNLYREAAAAISQKQSYEIMGRVWTGVDADKLWAIIRDLETRVSAATSGPAQNLVNFRRR